MIKSLNGLRFIFALLVVLCHYILPAPYNCSLFSEGGTIGVHFFFVLSGFLLTLQYEDKIKDMNFKPIPFLLKKIAKLYPLHIIIFLFWFIWTLKTNPISFDLIKKAFFNVLLLQSYIPNINYYFSFNTLSWYLCDILFLYVVFALFAKYFYNSKKPLILILILDLILSAILILFGHYVKSIDEFVFYIFPPVHLIDLLTGIWLCMLYKKIKDTELPSFVFIFFEIAAVAVFVLTVLISPRIPTKYRISFLYIFAMSFIVFVFALTDKKGPLAKLFSTKFFQFLGSISFSLYMIHLYMQHFVGLFLDRYNTYNDYPLVFFAVYLIATLFLSYICQKYFVNPIYTKQRNRIDEKYNSL
ncbi:MAG: acyltransferase [Spirochaetaceae bacterium]|nr:acyltransferase [Spirochaetaceae bacterium]